MFPSTRLRYFPLRITGFTPVVRGVRGVEGVFVAEEEEEEDEEEDEEEAEEKEEVEWGVPAASSGRALNDAMFR
jgi:hypothetical protein